MDGQAAAEMISMMENAGLMLFTAFEFRFSPVAEKIKSLLENRSIGEVRTFKLSYVWKLHGKF